MTKQSRPVVKMRLHKALGHKKGLVGNRSRHAVSTFDTATIAWRDSYLTPSTIDFEKTVYRS
ncbi:hypothetical protein MUK42_19729 [Musa troglodytarum]|uniref:Uncharacterized protein n=1 Tax=Musa troglodytarum TaxID=320322 RepID=A0A9E7FBP7_9LILI|nr:hypothetical protein MUK42_19729 [Musa troglodytarum]